VEGADLEGEEERRETEEEGETCVVDLRVERLTQRQREEGRGREREREDEGEGGGGREGGRGGGTWKDA
jgi:hypothetical protein